MILATELQHARELLGDDSLRWLSGNTLCLDLGLHHHRGDPTVVSDMDESGWVGRYSTTNPSIAPEGEELIQAQMPIRPQETPDQTALRLERLLDVSLEDRHARETWRRRQVMDGRSGALDLPGTTWRDRPAIARGNGVFLAGDMVAAPGLLCEVSWASAVEASRLALAEVGVTAVAADGARRAPGTGTAAGRLSAAGARGGSGRGRRARRERRQPRSRQRARAVGDEVGRRDREVLVEHPARQPAVLEAADHGGQRAAGRDRADELLERSIPRTCGACAAENAP